MMRQSSVTSKRRGGSPYLCCFHVDAPLTVFLKVYLHRSHAPRKQPFPMLLFVQRASSFWTRNFAIAQHMIQAQIAWELRSSISYVPRRDLCSSSWLVQSSDISSCTRPSPARFWRPKGPGRSRSNPPAVTTEARISPSGIAQ